MGKEEELRQWVHRMGDRFAPARSPGLSAEDDDASARSDSSNRELRTEAATLLRQCQAGYSDLELAGLPARELRDYRDRFNAVSAMISRSQAQGELRRAITDLRSLLRDLSDRSRELPAGGLDGDVDIVDDIALREEFPASSYGDDDREALLEELRGIHERIVRAHTALRGRIPEEELSHFTRRQHAIVDLLDRFSRNGEAPPNAELRRTIPDAHDLLNDLAARARAVRDQGGRDQGGRDAPATGAAPEDGREAYEQAQALYARLQEAIPDETTELENFRRQVDSLWGRIERGNAAERERSLIDLRGMITDMQRRLQAASRR